MNTINATIPLIMGTVAFALFLTLLLVALIVTMRNRRQIRNRQSSEIK